MPTRLLVLLQRRKSARAGSAVSADAATSNAPASMGTPASTQVPAVRGRAAARRILDLVYRCLIPPAFQAPDGPNVPISREFLRTVNDDSPEVVHVGQRRSWRHKIAESFEEFGRIVVVKKDGRIEAEAARPAERAGVDEGAGGVLRRPAAAIGAVGIARERRDAFSRTERDRERQRIFLVGPAATLAAQRHGELATGQDHGAAALCREIARDLRVGGGDLAGLALDFGAEQDAVVAGGAHRILRCPEDFRRPDRQREGGGGENRVA